MSFNAAEDAATAMKIHQAGQPSAVLTAGSIDADRQRPDSAGQLTVVNPSDVFLLATDQHHKPAEALAHFGR